MATQSVLTTFYVSMLCCSLFDLVFLPFPFLPYIVLAFATSLTCPLLPTQIRFTGRPGPFSSNLQLWNAQRRPARSPYFILRIPVCISLRLFSRVPDLKFHRKDARLILCVQNLQLYYPSLSSSYFRALWSAR